MPGPPPGTGCTVCEHPQHARINAILSEGAVSRRRVARDFGLNKDAVGRHCWNRHRGYDPKPKAAPDTSGEDEEGPVSERAALLVIKKQLEEEMAARPRSDLSRELRQVTGRLAEIDGMNAVKSLGVEDVAGLPEQVAAWFRALEPFPDARAAMLAATDPKLLEASGVAAEAVPVGEPVTADA